MTVDYMHRFGFVLRDKDIIVDAVRVRGIGKSFKELGPSVFEQEASLDFKAVDKSKSKSTASVYFEDKGRVEDCPVYEIEDLEEGDLLTGPALIIDDTQTVVVDPEPVKCKVLKQSLLIEL